MNKEEAIWWDEFELVLYGKSGNTFSTDQLTRLESLLDRYVSIRNKENITTYKKHEKGSYIKRYIDIL